ncbi:hypothetical protein AVEN_100433-1 [Araneus ventricosus]|uniref:Uncharacterized protein n=1 Tax=Araneus ventricosus TaxID=182803 RepID=A0A4Y2D0N5_ARAVE|nr:hypothetical protein AVEN_100433-1 [Araneus ventricosus]
MRSFKRKADTTAAKLLLKNTLVELSGTEVPLLCSQEKWGRSIVVLLGADVAGKLFSGRLEEMKTGLNAMETKLEWTLIGKVPQYECFKERHDDTTKKLEKIGYLEAHHQVFEEWLQEGIIKDVRKGELSLSNSHHLPPRPVINLFDENKDCLRCFCQNP